VILHAYPVDDAAGIQRSDEIRATLMAGLIPQNVEIVLLSEDEEQQAVELAEWLNNKAIKGDIQLDIFRLALDDDEVC